MAIVPPDELWPKLEELGEEEVRSLVARSVYGPRKLPTVQAWLDKKEREREESEALALGHVEIEIGNGNARPKPLAEPARLDDGGRRQIVGWHTG